MGIFAMRSMFPDSSDDHIILNADTDAFLTNVNARLNRANHAFPKQAVRRANIVHVQAQTVRRCHA